MTDQERQRFADWLEIEADSGEQMAAQTEKLPGPPMVTLSKMLRMEAAAMRLVAKKLRSTESMSISGESR